MGYLKTRNGSRIGAILSSAACISFALLFYAGDVKASQAFAWVPFDLTLGMAIAAAALSAMSFLSRNRKISIQVMWMIAFFLLIAVAAIWTEWTPYAIEKCGRLFTFTLLAAVLPAFILTRIQMVRLFVASIIASGTLISIGGLLQVLNGVTIADKVTGINANTISLGRDSGIAFVGLYTAVLCGTSRRLWLGALSIPLALVLFSSGSRGPVLFAAAVAVFVTFRWSLTRARSALTVVVLFALGISLLALFPGVLPEGSVTRIGEFVQQRWDSSAEERVLAGTAALREIGDAPFGLGIGGFARIYSFGSTTDRVYPHNMILEIAVEHGWLAGIFFLVMVFFGLLRSYRAAVGEPLLRPFFAVFLFAFLNALVSGDINDNRILYALLGIALLSPELLTARRASSYWAQAPRFVIPYPRGARPALRPGRAPETT